jgi:hypothetical protein
MGELIELLGEFPADRNEGRSESLMERLASLEARARAYSAPAETLAAIQGARVLMELAELPPLPRDGLPSHAAR